MKRVLMILFLCVLFFTACESPMDINEFSLDEITGSLINRSVLKNDDNFTIGYTNGNIRSSQVSLSWAQCEDEDFFIYKLLRNNVEIVSFNDVMQTSWVDSFVSEDSYYIYQLSVYSKNGMAERDTVMIKTPRWDSPSDLFVDGLTGSMARLNWIDNSDSEDNFIVYFRNETQDVLIDSCYVEKNVTSIEKSGLSDTLLYSYKVKAVNSYEEDTEFSQVCGIDVTTFTFDPPSNLTAMLNIDNTVELSWYDNSTLETEFRLYRKINDGDSLEIAQPDINMESYCDADSLLWNLGDSLTYKIRAFNSYSGEFTDFSNEVTIHIVDLGSGTVAITLQVDEDYYESFWNILNLNTGNYYYEQNQGFTSPNQLITRNILLEPGEYYIRCYDDWYDGGIRGLVSQFGNTLISWDYNDYGSSGNFYFIVEDYREK